MKLGIIIPLKSKIVSQNWNITCENLKNTLESIINQKNNQYTTLVIGHEKPDFMNNDRYNSKKIEFLRIREFDPPKISEDLNRNQVLYEKDRCSKILKGIIHLKITDPHINYWYPLDADDLIHCDFTEEISKIVSRTSVDAIIFEKGYVLYKNKKTFNKENNFALYCGSSAIVHDSALSNQEILATEEYKSFLFGQVPHTAMHEVLASRQLKIEVPKKRLVLYCKDHGENISDETRPNNISYSLKRKIKLAIKKIYFTKKIMDNFSISQ